MFYQRLLAAVQSSGPQQLQSMPDVLTYISIQNNLRFVALYSTAGSKLAVKMNAVIKAHSTVLFKIPVIPDQTQHHASGVEC